MKTANKASKRISHYNILGLSVANSANPVCRGWEVKQSLLTKYWSYNRHPFFGSFQLCSWMSQVQFL